MSHAVWGDVAAREKPDSHCTGLLKELWLGVTCLDAEFDDLLGATSPAFDQPAPIKDISDKRIAWTRAMITFEIFHLEPKGERSIAPHLYAIIVNREADRPPALSIIPVADRIDERLPQRCRGKQRLVDPFKEAWLDTSGDRKVTL